jgi:hypothetical protein
MLLENKTFRPQQPIKMEKSVFTANEPINWIHDIPCDTITVSWQPFQISMPAHQAHDFLKLARQFPPDQAWFEGEEPEIF